MATSKTMAQHISEKAEFKALWEREKSEHDKTKSELVKQKKENLTLQSELYKKNTEDGITKEILCLFASNNSYHEIFEKAKFKGYKDITIDVIKEICVNRENLRPDLYKYYLEQEKAYIDNVKINPDLYKDKLMLRYERLYSDCEMDLANNDLTFDEKNKIKAQMSDILNKQNAVLKNIVDDSDNKEDRSITILKETMSEYEDNVSNIVKLTINPSEIKTLDKIN